MALSWHNDSDVQELRQQVYSQIYTLFQQRKTGGQNWSEKLPDFVKRLEQALFSEAKTKEDYGNFATLESRLQLVARGLVHRPSAGSGSAPQAAPGHMSNGAYVSQGFEQQQQQTMQADGLSHQLMLPSAYPGAQGMQQGMGMIPTPNTGIPSSSGMYSVKAEPLMGQAGTGSTLPNGMIPVDAAGSSGMGNSAYQQPGGMISVPGLMGHSAMGSTPLMSNGAPVLIKQDNWSAASHSPSMIPTNNTGGMGAGGVGSSMPVQMPGGAAGGFVPQNAAGSGMMPNPGAGMMPVPGSSMQGGGMMPTPGSSMAGGGMMPTPGAGGGMMPTPGSSMAGSGMMPTPGSGMGATGMMPTPGSNSGMVPMGGGSMMPTPGSGMMPTGMMNAASNAGGSTMIPMGGMAGQQQHQSSQQQSQQQQMLQQPQQQQLQQQQQSSQQQQQHQQQQQQSQQQQQQQQQPIANNTGAMMPGSNGLMMMPGSSAAMQAASTSPNGAFMDLPAVSQPMAGQAGSGFPQQSGEQLQKNLQDRQQYIQKQQRWLLFLRHCAKCQQGEDECQFGRSCRVGKELWTHILSCNNSKCTYPRCTSSKDLLKHHQKCQNVQCPICTPVKEYVRRTRTQAGAAGGMPGAAQPTGSMTSNPLAGGSELQQSQQTQQAMAMQQQMQAQQQQQAVSSQMLGQKRPLNGMDPAAAAAMPAGSLPPGMMPVGPHSTGAMMGMVPQAMPQQQQYQQGAGSYGAMPAGGGGMQGMQQGTMPLANGSMDEQHIKRVKQEGNNQQLLAKNTGTSLLECFDLTQIRVHLDQIQTAAQQTKTAAQLPVNPGDDCKVCGLTKLTFEPPCIYCTQCGQRIKRGQIYHCTLLEPGCDFRGFWCHSCLSEHKGDKIPWEGNQTGVVRKADLQKKKNDDEIEEGWVQCDACESWVHQICGLFNKGKNDQNVHYLCPKCLMLGLETGQREGIRVRPQAMLEAKDLPQNNLSMLLEQRVNRKLEEDRQARAAQQGIPPWEVPTAEGLTIRVINNVIKKCEVKQKFYEAFRGDGYAEAFIYRQRVVVLFQKIDGVDVALYCMYVQEYGADCAPPNRKVVYLSYIDSVKYFRPELASHNGVSLRTYVYHQILQGYLDYVKRLGFEQMFIWACPPLAGDDYILYCHPSKQKTPRSDRLRAWYHDMLRKARAEDGSVCHVSTLWDTFFEGGREHRLDKCSVTTIPYLEGDYWPGEAENLLLQISDAQRSVVSGGSNTALGRKAGGAKGKRYGSGPQSTDEALLSRLGEILGGNMKEDFMVVHLQEPCSFCRKHVANGVLHKYVPTGPGGATLLNKPAPAERRFEGIRLESPGPNLPSGPLQHLQICSECYSTEATRVSSGQKSRLPGGLTLTDLVQTPVNPIQMTQDRDPDMGSEFFETRQAFLSLCQGNHYQFDSMRRAKHSSMMVLYHLHNPEAPAFSSTCNFCHVEIEPGTGLRCTVCSDFDMCKNCMAAGMRHEHPMVATTNFANRDEMRSRLTEQERIERNQQLQKTLALLVHACSCHNPQCGSTSCRKVRALFQHAVQCTQKVTGGCHLCKKMWCLLNLHAKSCTTSDCPVPRCRELKELRRRQTAHIEQKRRAAYSNMMRNAAAGAK